MNRIYSVIEDQLSIAPLRIFRDHEMRGYFESELIEKFNLTKDNIKVMKKMRLFKKTLKTLDGKPELFYCLR